MRILLCTPIYPPEIDETAQYSRMVATRLQQAGHTVSVLTYANHPIRDDLTIFSVKKSWPMWLRLVLYIVKLFWLALRHDVVYVQEVIASGFPASWAALFFRKKIIVHVHVDELWKRSHTYEHTESRRKKIVQYVLRRAAVVIASSGALRDYLVKTYGVKKENCEVVYDPFFENTIFPFTREKNNKKISISCSKKMEQRCRQVIDDMYKLVFIRSLPAAEQQYHIESSVVHIVLDTDDLRPNDVYCALQHNVPLIVRNSHPAVEIVHTTDACIIDTIEQIPAVLDRIVAGSACIAHVEYLDWDAHTKALEKILT